MGASDIARCLRRIAHEILERNKGADDLVVLGIPSRGVELANRLAAMHREVEGAASRRALDITMHRDDLRHQPTRAPMRTHIPTGGIDDKVVVLVDDVLYSGRTIRAALDALADLGPPARRAAGRARRPGPPRAADPRRPRRQEPADVHSEKVQVRLAGHDGIDDVVRIAGGESRPMNRHLLSSADLTTRRRAVLLDTAAEMHDVQRREVKKLPTLRGRTIINLFFEDSTRTRSSFEIAGKWMSADTINITGKGPRRPRASPCATPSRPSTPWPSTPSSCATWPAAPVTRWPVGRRQRHQRRRRHARAPDPGPARRLHHAISASATSTASTSRSSATSPTAGSSAPTSIMLRTLGARVTVVAPPTLMPSGIRPWARADGFALSDDLDAVLADDGPDARHDAARPARADERRLLPDAPRVHGRLWADPRPRCEPWLRRNPTPSSATPAR
jgi:pyrimidine operon attenuation protein/uracil phosphoribosyltransferase